MRYTTEGNLFKDSNRQSFPVDPSCENYFNVPTFNNTVESLLIKRFGPKAAFGTFPCLFSKELKPLEKIAYQGHLAARIEVEAFLEKGAIEKVPQSEIGQGVYSTLFLVPKKTKDLRPVVNLKPLHQYLVKEHFKMDTLTKVLTFVKPQDWALSLDLKDAYLHVPIHKSNLKYLRFCIQGNMYQFVALCFGPSQAPRAFTKIVTVIASHLRNQNVRPRANHFTSGQPIKQ
ncbi:unnamed protein product [Mytilus coruscus]|uniref:Reverse transcriptase domain-containing protein n=1 Tax=Mytilus coruscus TaxID=42192 RepID=A0A6J8CIM3_MYTCO|nr:unnamed protein product [Mytilus coruscus]